MVKTTLCDILLISSLLTGFSNTAPAESLKLSFIPPTENVDGSPLTDLEYLGVNCKTNNDASRVVSVFRHDDPYFCKNSKCSTEIDGYQPGDTVICYAWVMNESGIKSDNSEFVSKVFSKLSPNENLSEQWDQNNDGEIPTYKAISLRVPEDSQIVKNASFTQGSNVYEPITSKTFTYCIDSADGEEYISTVRNLTSGDVWSSLDSNSTCHTIPIPVIMGENNIEVTSESSNGTKIYEMYNVDYEENTPILETIIEDITEGNFINNKGDNISVGSISTQNIGDSLMYEFDKPFEVNYNTFINLELFNNAPRLEDLVLQVKTNFGVFYGISLILDEESNKYRINFKSLTKGNSPAYRKHHIPKNSEIDRVYINIGPHTNISIKTIEITK
jgi:hypothetical protein